MISQTESTSLTTTTTTSPATTTNSHGNSNKNTSNNNSTSSEDCLQHNGKKANLSASVKSNKKKRFEETIIDGFAIVAFKTWEDLQDELNEKRELSNRAIANTTTNDARTNNNNGIDTIPDQVNQIGHSERKHKSTNHKSKHLKSSSTNSLSARLTSGDSDQTISDATPTTTTSKVSLAAAKKKDKLSSSKKLSTSVQSHAKDSKEKRNKTSSEKINLKRALEAKDLAEKRVSILQEKLKKEQSKNKIGQTNSNNGTAPDQYSGSPKPMPTLLQPKEESLQHSLSGHNPMVSTITVEATIPSNASILDHQDLLRDPSISLPKSVPYPPFHINSSQINQRSISVANTNYLPPQSNSPPSPTTPIRNKQQHNHHYNNHQISSQSQHCSSSAQNNHQHHLSANMPTNSYLYPPMHQQQHSTPPPPISMMHPHHSTSSPMQLNHHPHQHLQHLHSQYQQPKQQPPHSQSHQITTHTSIPIPPPVSHPLHNPTSQPPQPVPPPLHQVYHHPQHHQATTSMMQSMGLNALPSPYSCPPSIYITDTIRRETSIIPPPPMGAAAAIAALEQATPPVPASRFGHSTSSVSHSITPYNPAVPPHHAMYYPTLPTERSFFEFARSYTGPGHMNYPNLMSSPFPTPTPSIAATPYGFDRWPRAALDHQRAVNRYNSLYQSATTIPDRTSYASYANARPPTFPAGLFPPPF